MNLKPAVIELDVGPASKCPLWVKSGHVQRKSSCLLYTQYSLHRDSLVEVSQFENQEHYRCNREEHHPADTEVGPPDTSIGFGILAHGGLFPPADDELSV